MAFWLSPKLAGLRWIDADLAGARLSPRRPRVAVNYVVHESEPKTRMGKRALALDPATVAALREHQARQELLSHLECEGLPPSREVPCGW